MSLIDYMHVNPLILNVKLIHLSDTNFDAPDAHFDYLSLFSGNQAKKVGNPKKGV
jgi:hypothetical protein